MSYLIPTILKDTYNVKSEQIVDFFSDIDELNKNTIEIVKRINDQCYNLNFIKEHLKKTINEIIKIINPIYYKVVCSTILYLLVKKVIPIEKYFYSFLSILFVSLYFIKKNNRYVYIKKLFIYASFFTLVKIYFQFIIYLILL